MLFKQYVTALWAVGLLPTLLLSLNPLHEAQLVEQMRARGFNHHGVILVVFEAYRAHMIIALVSFKRYAIAITIYYIVLSLLLVSAGEVFYVGSWPLLHVQHAGQPSLLSLFGGQSPPA